MSIINDEMKQTADYAIKTSRERFKQEFDFSEQSIAQLDIILERIYYGFYSQSKDSGEGGLIFQTAIIWGSYLGEYMRRKWGGTWILNGKNRLLSIINIEFSPIDLVYQKITTHPEYTVKNYLIETEKIINNTAVISPQPPQSLPIHAGQPTKKTSEAEPTKKTPKAQPAKTKSFDKRNIILFASIGAIFLLIFGCIGAYMIVGINGVSALGFLVHATSTSTESLVVETLVTATPIPVDTQTSTVTPSPTSTPNPTFTQVLSFTPSQTPTQTATSTPTATNTLIIPTRTRTPSPTSVTRNPTKTPIPPTEAPQPTATEPPQPTATTQPQPTVTQPAPVVIDSCEVNPSTVPVGQSVTITFIVNFSSRTPGYGFDAAVNPIYPGQSGCSGVDSDGDGMAYCDGSSGELPELTTVFVTLSSPVGNCDVSYSSQ